MKPFTKILIGLLVLGVISCTQKKISDPDTIVIGIEKSPEQFDPRIASDSMSQKINTLVFSGLLKFNDQLDRVPDIAESVTIETPTLYRLTLNSKATFHDGKPVTSADVKATYESMLKTDVRSPYAASLDIIQTISTPSDHEIIFELKKPNSPFLTLLTLGIVPQSYVDLPIDEQKKAPPVGCGPFALASKPDMQSDVILTRHSLFHGSVAKTKNIRFRVIQDATLRSLETINGKLDLVQNNIAYAMLDTIRHTKKLTVQSSDGAVFAYLAFNFKNKYLADLHVRQAIAMAIDRKSIIEHKLAGEAKPATSLISPSSWAHHKSLKPIEFDLARARQLLDDAGYTDPDGDGPLARFSLHYKTSTNKERIEIAQLIAENLKSIGIDVAVESYEIGTFLRDIKQGDFDMYSLTWSGITDPDMLYSVYHSSMIPPNGVNRGFYSNASLDPILEQSRIESNQTKLFALYQQAQEIAYNDMVYAPLWYENNIVVTANSLKNYHARPDASYIHLTEATKEP